MATSAIPSPARAAVPKAAPHRRLSIALITLLVLFLGAVEGWFGKTDSGDVYGSDAVQYLDCARALARHDIHAALNPLWSQGYPTLLALTHAVFPVAAQGSIQADWLATRLVNFLIFAFCWLTFGFFLAEFSQFSPLPRLSPLTLAVAAAVFLTAQVCLDQVSRVGPDQLVAALFFLACALLLRLRRAPAHWLAALLGLTLGIGFLVKAVFLVLGCVILTVTFLALQKRTRILPAAAVFAAIVLTYGAALSHATGYPTLGEAGSLNYAWHVNRLGKWVHWQGGADPAEKAWPRPAIARFAQWQTDPPDFGAPIHPTRQVGRSPTAFVFDAPGSSAQATYPPYCDPAYFYRGYRHLFRWRYQLIALLKNLSDLFLVLLSLPLAYACALVLPFRFGAFARTVRLAWPAAVCALAGIALYLPVHLEGRYLSAFFAVIALVLLVAVEAAPKHRTALLSFLLVAAGACIVHNQAPVWVRAAHHWSPRDNPEWRAAQAVQAAGLPRGTPIGMISWTPNLHADWAYMTGLRITSEIASGPDEAAFWALTPAEQATILEEFHHAGATAVLTQDPPRNQNSDWQQLPRANLWLHSLQP